MTLQAGRNYEIKINTTDSELNSVSGIVDNLRLWSPNIFEIANNYKAVDMPGVDGGDFTGEGYRKPRTIQLIGSYIGLAGSANESYPDQHIQAVYQLADKIQYYRDSDMYVEIETRSGSGSSGGNRMLFVKPLRYPYVPTEGTYYTAGQVNMSFLVADPDFYEVDETTGSGSGAAGQASAVIVNTIFENNRFTVKVENLDNGSALTNPSAESVARTGYNWSISGSITGSGDYWIVDHSGGTVTKYVDGTGTDDIANFTGTFFPLGALANVIRATGSGDEGGIRVTVTTRRKAEYNVS